MKCQSLFLGKMSGKLSRICRLLNLTQRVVHVKVNNVGIIIFNYPPVVQACQPDPRSLHLFFFSSFL